MSEKDKATLEKAKKELEEGASALAERQKHIRIADQSEHSWETVAAYIGNDVATNEDDARRIEKAEKTAEQRVSKRKRKVAATTAFQRAKRPVASTGAPAQGPPQPPPFLLPRPAYGQPSSARPVGPCWTCGEVGHLKTSCPRLSKPYPFMVVDTCHSRVDNKVLARASQSGQGKAGQCSEPLVDTKLKPTKGIQKETCLSIGEVGMGLGFKVETGLSMGKGTSHPQGANDLTEPFDTATHASMSEGTDTEVAESWEAECENTHDLVLSRFWEMERGQVTDVQGKLKANISFWEQKLQPAPWIISCIKEGYKLPLRSIPDPYIRPNQASALANKEFITQAISEMVQNRCVVKVANQPHVCSPLSVVSNSVGKQRLVINLRYLNGYLWKDKFKYEDMRIAMLLFQQGDYMFSFDLKSGYHHIDIFEPHRQYLGFSWDQGGSKQFYTFTVLPFGLATACYAFTKLLRPLVKYWRSQGLRAILYLDDGIVAVSGKDAARQASYKVRQDLRDAGLVEHIDKCNWVPTQQITWLGFSLDLDKGQVFVPTEKVERLKSQLGQVQDASTLKARDLASIIGKLISMSLAIGPVARLMTRSLYTVLNSRHFWCQSLHLTPEARQEILFWLTNLDKVNGQGIWHSPSAIRVVYADASATGYGGFTVEHGCHIAHGLFSEIEAAQSSTWRELHAVRMVLSSLAHMLHNQRVRWFSDNQNVTRIIEIGSKNPKLQKEALEIYSMAVKWQIRIEPEWIPREQNQRADLLSRIVDRDDWSIHPAVFQQLELLWGPHTIDRFANYLNTQLPRFNSRFWNPGSEAVDAFTCDWAGENNWLCPPPFLVPRVIRHALKTGASGTLVVPKWPSAPFWPILFPDGCSPAPFVSEEKTLDRSSPLVVAGQSGSSLFKGVPNTDLLALRLVCNKVNPNR